MYIDEFALKVTTWILTQFVLNPLLFGIVYHNGNGILNYQSIIDKVFVYICLLNIDNRKVNERLIIHSNIPIQLHVYLFSMILVWNLTGYNLLLLRVFVEMPKIACIVAKIQSHTILVTSMVTVSEKITLRLSHMYVLKTEKMVHFFLFKKCTGFCILLFGKMLEL